MIDKTTTNMARFVEPDDDDIEALLENRDAKNTKKAIKTALNILTAYCASKDVLFSDIEQLPVEDLCSLLKGFYAAARNQKGHYYSKKSMISIR